MGFIGGHMDKSKYIKWFENTRDFFNECIGDSNITDELLSYEIYSAIWSCLKEDENEEQAKWVKAIIEALINSLEAEGFFKEELWEKFWNNSQEYQEFMGKYHLPDENFLRDVGTFWLRMVDKIDSTEDKNVRIEFSRQVGEYSLWLIPYCTIFTYQYLIQNPNCGEFAEERLTVLQYWEYREIECYMEKIGKRPIEEQIISISRRYCETEFDKMFPDCEGLYIELLDKGLPISEAFVITNRVQKGKGLTESLYNKLKDCGITKEVADQINNIRYLKSRRNAIVTFLYLKELV